MSREFALSGRKYLIDASIHFFFFNQLAAIRLSYAIPHRLAKIQIILKETEGRVLDQLLGVAARDCRDGREAGFFVGRKANFHGPSIEQRGRYSYRSASAGSTRAAELEGYNVASRDTPSDSAVTITPCRMRGAKGR